MHRSTTRRRAPPGAYVLAILHNAGHRRITVRKYEHLLASLAVILRVVIYKLDTLLGVIITRLLTIGTPRLCKDH